MAILVLGGAGYIGSHTVYELIDAGRDVVVADNLQTGFRAAVHPKAKFYQLDIRDKGALDTLFQAEHIEITNPHGLEWALDGECKVAYDKVHINVKRSFLKLKG